MPFADLIPEWEADTLAGGSLTGVSYQERSPNVAHDKSTKRRVAARSSDWILPA